MIISVSRRFLAPWFTVAWWIFYRLQKNAELCDHAYINIIRFRLLTRGSWVNSSVSPFWNILAWMQFKLLGFYDTIRRKKWLQDFGEHWCMTGLAQKPTSSLIATKEYHQSWKFFKKPRKQKTSSGALNIYPNHREFFLLFDLFSNF